MIAPPLSSPPPPTAAGKSSTAQRLGRTLVRSSLNYSLGLLAVDILLLFALFNLTIVLRNGFWPLFFFDEVLVLTVVAAVTGLALTGGYDLLVNKNALAYATQHLLGLAVAAVAALFLLTFAATYGDLGRPSRSVMLAVWTLFIPLSLLFRRWLQWSVHGITSRKTILVVGGQEALRDFWRQACRLGTVHRLRFVTPGTERGQRLQGPDSPRLEGDLGKYLRRPLWPLEAVVLAGPEDAGTEPFLLSLMRLHFERTRVFTDISFHAFYWKRIPPERVGGRWAIEGEFILTRNSAYQKIKRLSDLVVGATALTLAAPFMLLISAAILLLQGRPIFFRQPRVGLGQEIFHVWKFRTMVVGAHHNSETTRPGDPRITPLGRVLRTTRLDELPQLFNILRGEMSVIGPRAEWTECVKVYEHAIPFYHIRHFVRPGLTGWAQVNYPYGGDVHDAREKLAYDLFYIRNHSFYLDAQILLKTLYTVLVAAGR